jgi:hypothetical protein
VALGVLVLGVLAPALDALASPPLGALVSLDGAAGGGAAGGEALPELAYVVPPDASLALLALGAGV